MEIRHLREFVSLAESLSYNQTAASFFISKSALSKHIKSVATELGVPLFIKSSTNVELTLAGRVFYAECLEMLEAWEKALVHVKDAADDMYNTINIGCPNAVIRDITDIFVDFFETINPETRTLITEIRPKDVVPALRSGFLDALVGINLDISDPSYEKIHLFDDMYYAVIGKNHPLASNDSIKKEDLVNKVLLLPSQDVMFGSKEFLSKFLPSSINVSSCRRYQNFDALLLWVINGDYIGFSAGFKKNQYKNDVKFIPIEDADTTLSIDAYWSREANPGAKANLVQAFNQVREVFEI